MGDLRLVIGDWKLPTNHPESRTSDWLMDPEGRIHPNKNRPDVCATRVFRAIEERQSTIIRA
jgi:hypothetical protein